MGLLDSPHKVACELTVLGLGSENYPTSKDGLKRKPVPMYCPESMLPAGETSDTLRASDWLPDRTLQQSLRALKEAWNAAITSLGLVSHFLNHFNRIPCRCFKNQFPDRITDLLGGGMQHRWNQNTGVNQSLNCVVLKKVC